jgi:hypothetical protein
MAPEAIVMSGLVMIRTKDPFNRHFMSATYMNKLQVLFVGVSYEF